MSHTTKPACGRRSADAHGAAAGCAPHGNIAIRNGTVKMLYTVGTICSSDHAASHREPGWRMKGRASTWRE